MRDVLIDSQGEFVCPYCNGRNFDRERTGKGKTTGFLTVGVGVFLVPKRMHCLVCGKYSKSGNANTAVPAGPSPSRAAELRAKYDNARQQRAAEPTVSAPPTTRSPEEIIDSLAKLDALRRDGFIDDAEFEDVKGRVIDGGQPPDADRLRQLNSLKESGAISEDEYASLQKAVLRPAAEPKARTLADVVLVDPGRKKINVIKIVRQVTGWGLAEAKRSVDAASAGEPQTIKSEVAVATAKQIAEMLKAIGAEVELR